MAKVNPKKRNSVESNTALVQAVLITTDQATTTKAASVALCKQVDTPKRTPKYTLAELIARCDLQAAPPQDLSLWDNAQPVGSHL